MDQVTSAIAHRVSSLCLLLLLVCPASVAASRPLAADAIPEALRPWQGWVLHGQEQRTQCTPDHNAALSVNCIWPSTLTLHLLPTGGEFRQEWEVLTDDSWLQLPGEKRFWPEGVTINDRPALVVEREGVPFILAPKGEQRVKGRFQWPARPESFQVPATTALIEVTVDNVPMTAPVIDDNGRLWLRSTGQASEQQVEETLNLRVFRLIDDLIPPRITIHLDIQAAGKRREVNLGALFPMDAFIPLTLTGSLPAKLEKNGDLRIQVKPGEWQVDLTIRHQGPLSELSFAFPPTPGWPETEIWSFQDQPSLRVVKIEGEPGAIDPSQTTVPPAWRDLPAYLVKSGQKLLFPEIKRGEPNPPPDQLQLNRDLWLNFAGSGYTVRDTITGAKHNNWRLGTLGNRLQLGRVTLEGQDQLITSLGDDGATGVEIRQGIIDLTAVSTLTGPVARIPATGFDTTFQSAAITLHLPPGYSLFNLNGAEDLPDTWLGAWTLLDLFLLCISTIACYKVFGPASSLVCLVTLALLYHQPEAPLWGWLNIIAVVALLRVLPEGKFKGVLAAYRNLSLLAVVIIAIPFMVTQIRQGLYPQLEGSSQRLEGPESSRPLQMKQAVEKRANAPSPERALSEDTSSMEAMPNQGDRLSGRALAPTPRKLELVDPDAKIQTGPGLPAWQWQQAHIRFNGPVTREQTLSIILLGPTVNLILAVCRCLAILLFLGLIADVALPSFRSAARKLALLALLIPLLAPRPGQARDLPAPGELPQAGSARGVSGEIPSPELLEELQGRLLEPAACFPECVAADSMTIREEGERLVITLAVSAYVRSAVPLPGNLPQWQPEQVRFAGEQERAPALLRKGEALWIAVESGQSTIEIIPRLDRRMRSLQINLPLIPHRLTTSLTDWRVVGGEGLSPIPGSLTLERTTPAEQVAEQVPELTAGALPPFFSVERTLTFGLTWQVETVVHRPPPADSAVVLTLPLLKGESVLTDNITVREGGAKLVFAQGIEAISFSSNLSVSPEVGLTHARTDLYSETWRIVPSSIWHIEYSGAPVISHQADNRWLPTWRPWPGESVLLTISRPRAVAGPIKTIDASALSVEAGKNAAKVTLAFTLRSSQGGQHGIKVPRTAEAIQRFEINGRAYPIQKDSADRLVFPVIPGQQEVRIEWTQRSPVAMRYATPAVDLGLASTNSEITMRIGRDRWPLMLWGPRLGPAVLWWSFIVITLLAALGLARIPAVPVRCHQWLLLGIGMLQTSPLLPVIFALWLIALAKRREISKETRPGLFNAIQFGLTLLTLAALGALMTAISNGLLGYPDMQIRGNGSGNTLFHWYQDISPALLPQGHLISVPLWSYRLLMLAWALWISFFLIRLLKWGWQCFATDRLWVSSPLRPRREK